MGRESEKAEEMCIRDRYYMIGFDSEAGLIKHYRVDKMLGIALTDEPRDGQEHFEHFDMAVYTRQVFGMFGGNEQTVTLRFENRLLGVVDVYKRQGCSCVQQKVYTH